MPTIEERVEELKVSEERRQASIDALTIEHAERLNFHKDNYEGWFRAWMLSLAVGNGGGLLTLGAALINGWKLGIWFVIVPALWIFAVGLCCAGVAPLIRSRYHLALQIENQFGRIWLRSTEAHRDAIERRMNKARTRGNASQRLAGKVAVVAMVAFGLGLAWPLAVVTLWLFHALPAGLSWPYPTR